MVSEYIVGQDVAILSNFATQLYYTVYYTVSDVPQYACCSHCYTLLHLQESLYIKAHTAAHTDSHTDSCIA